jgi:hypothetical protein
MKNKTPSAIQLAMLAIFTATANLPAQAEPIYYVNWNINEAHRLIHYSSLTDACDAGCDSN